MTDNMTEKPKIDELPVDLHVLMVGKLLTMKASSCLEEQPPDLPGAALCIDTARAVDRTVNDRIDKMLYDMLKQDLAAVQTEYARTASSSRSDQSGDDATGGDDDGGSDGAAEPGS